MGTLDASMASEQALCSDLADCQVEAAGFKGTLEEAQAEEVTKKMLAEYLLEVAPEDLKEKHKMSKSAIKKNPKDFFLTAYADLLSASGPESGGASNCTDAAPAEAEPPAEGACPEEPA